MRHPAAGVIVLALLSSGCGRDQPAPQGSGAPPAASAAPTTTTTTTTTLPPPPPAWGASRWGMTKDEVLAAFPGQAQRLAQPAPFGPGVPGTTDVAIPAWEGEGARFRVLFGFEADALSRVHLTAIKPGEATCGDVEKALAGRFSEPSARNSTGTSLRGEEVVWKRPDHTVTLSCAGVHALGFRSVTLAYTPPG